MYLSGKELPRMPFVNCCQFMYLVISLLVLRAGYRIWFYQFLIIAYLFTLDQCRLYHKVYIPEGNCFTSSNGYGNHKWSDTWCGYTTGYKLIAINGRDKQVALERYARGINMKRIYRLMTYLVAYLSRRLTHVNQVIIGKAGLFPSYRSGYLKRIRSQCQEVWIFPNFDEKIPYLTKKFSKFDNVCFQILLNSQKHAFYEFNQF